MQRHHPACLYLHPERPSDRFSRQHMAGFLRPCADLLHWRSVRIQSAAKKSSCLCRDHEHPGRTHRHLLPCMAHPAGNNRSTAVCRHHRHYDWYGSIFPATEKTIKKHPKNILRVFLFSLRSLQFLRRYLHSEHLLCLLQPAGCQLLRRCRISV